VIDYVTASGFNVVRDKAMNLEAKDFGSVTPAQWAQMAKELDGPDIDGVFLSCTNTTQIEAIADIERQLGKPVVNSNQAVLWGCVKRLKKTLPPLKPMPALGRLMGHLD
jgi:maleate isomerase